MLNPAFIDFESNGLDGFPIEVGYAWVEPESKNIVSGSWLIKPDPEWDLAENWDADAEQIHGISLAQLMANGVPTFQVAQQLNHALAGRDLYSDSPFDQRWMQQLFDSAGFEPTFNFMATVAQVIIDKLRVELGFTEDDVADLYRRTEHKSPHTDRAEPDARQLAAIWAALLTFKKA